MVSADQCDPIGIPHFQRKQQQKCLHAVETAVHKITHEEIVRVWAIPSNLEQLHQVIELPMNVTTYRHRCVYPLDVALFHENL